MVTGLRFDETMSGPVAIGDGRELTVRLRVEIDDMARFLDDPQHRGRVVANAEDAGTVAVFAPTVDPRVYVIRYDVPVDVADRRYRLVGVKRCATAGLRQLWPATTTLHTTLYDESGAVAATGVLRIGLGRLLRSVLSMRGAVCSYLRFFTGELVATYLWRRV